MALQLGERGVEELHGAPVLHQLVSLGQAEQPQQLLGGGVRALALLGIDGSSSMPWRAMARRNSRSMRALGSLLLVKALAQAMGDV